MSERLHRYKPRNADHGGQFFFAAIKLFKAIELAQAFPGRNKYPTLKPWSKSQADRFLLALGKFQDTFWKMDRATEMAAVLVLEPIFEADLQPEQYAYRRDRSALDAVRHVQKLVNTGHGEIVDADLSSYFDTLPHSELLKSVAPSKTPRVQLVFLETLMPRRFRSRLATIRKLDSVV